MLRLQLFKEDLAADVGLGFAGKTLPRLFIGALLGMVATALIVINVVIKAV